jgi:hypothetical protein
MKKELIEESLCDIKNLLWKLEDNKTIQLVKTINRHSHEIIILRSRIDKLEMALEEKIGRDKQTTAMVFLFHFLETVRDYWHVFAIAAAAGGFFCAFFFGIRVRD